ncbi:hypothetical protein TTRE_0000302901 [Trichuris trichiura]|uniref:Uncharacterized protein n=1 Tax=Trichuris trichiura TaxID=36087 RepID=A0A077Z4L0_TRITR|nr:hypothetical protein TTRE_0000302901 [Trichuris trichiura]
MTEEQTSPGTEENSEESVELARGLSASFEAGSINLLKLSVGENAFPKRLETACSDLNLSGAEKRRDGGIMSRIGNRRADSPSTPYLSKVSTPVCGEVFNVDFALKVILTYDASGVFSAKPQSRYVISEEWVHETTEDFSSNCSAIISGSMHWPKVLTGSTHLRKLSRANSLGILGHPPRQTCRRRTKSV